MTTTQSTNIPHTIAALIEEVEAMGGEVERVAPRLFRVALPCRMVSGITRPVNRATVGYYVREDGKNVIQGIADARQEIAYWTRQSGVGR